MGGINLCLRATDSILLFGAHSRQQPQYCAYAVPRCSVRAL